MERPILDEMSEFIEQFTAKEGYSPSFREIGRAVGLSSTSSVDYYLKQLASQGRMTWKPGVARTIRVIR